MQLILKATDIWTLDACHENSGCESDCERAYNTPRTYPFGARIGAAAKNDVAGKL